MSQGDVYKNMHITMLGNIGKYDKHVSEKCISDKCMNKHRSDV